MKDAASLYRAVDRARRLITEGAHPGAAYELAARQQGVDLDTVRRLVHRAQAGCDAAREQQRRIVQAATG